MKQNDLEHVTQHITAGFSQTTTRPQTINKAQQHIATLTQTCSENASKAWNSTTTAPGALGRLNGQAWSKALGQ